MNILAQQIRECAIYKFHQLKQKNEENIFFPLFILSTHEVLPTLEFICILI